MKQYMARPNTAQLLALNGIESLSGSDDEKKELMKRYLVYKVLVHGLDIVSIYQRHVGAIARYVQLHPRQVRGSRAMKILCRQACRAVYGLGLDLARVTIIATGDRLGAYQVVSIDQDPVLTAAESTRITGLIANEERHAMDGEHSAIESEYSGIEYGGVVIGMDIEFLLCRADGKVVSAADYLERHGRAGYDGIRVRGKVVHPFVELRPQPSASPRQLFIHLLEAMDEAAAHIGDRKLTWLAGGMPKQGFRLGGHIHLSGVTLTAALLRTLDNYVALPLSLIEADSSRRRRPRYGLLGDYRRQFHGGFEYRTLPSFIVSPQIAKGVIALVHTVVQHREQLRQTPLNRRLCQVYFYGGEKEALLGTVQSLWAELERLPAYEHNQSALERLKDSIMKMEPWDEAADVRQAWRLPPYG